MHFKKRFHPTFAILALIAALAGTALMFTGAAARQQPRRAASQHASINCPAALPPGASAAKEVAAAVQAEVPSLYPGSYHEGFRIVAEGTLAGGAKSAVLKSFFDTPYRGIAAHMCGTAVANRSWIAFLFFPRLEWSADLSQGQDYVTRTKSGWRVWYVYH